MGIQMTNSLPLSRDQIAAIQARAEKASPGEWKLFLKKPTFKAAVVAFGSRPDPLIGHAAIFGFTEQANKDADFIFHSRTDIPALCQQALRAIELEAENKRHDQLHKDLMQMQVDDAETIQRLQSELTTTRKALEEERERCAKVAEEIAWTTKPKDWEAQSHANKIADAIRALPAPEVKP